MQARSEFGAAAHNDTAVRGNPGPGSFKSKNPLAVIATPDLDLWAQLGPMLESTVPDASRRQPRDAPPRCSSPVRAPSSSPTCAV